MIKVSVITLCKNNAATISSALQSYREQDYPNKEHIVVDGASTDDTLNIVKQFCPDIVVSEPDNGMYFAANKGIKLATGDVIAFLHADDVFASSTVLSQMISAMESDNTDSVFADLEYVDRANPEKIIRYWHSDTFSQKKLKYGWMPPHPTFFVKKCIYEQFGSFNTSLKIAADYDLMLRFLHQAKISVTYCPIVAVKMRVGGISNRSVSNIIKKMREDLYAARKNKVGGFFTLIMKNLRKVKQFFKH
ncbi:MAG: glycosyltransferase [Bacteroidales bacterium]|nr:glycosyltransferase [Bacteroidales bacterium]